MIHKGKARRAELRAKRNEEKRKYNTYLRECERMLERQMLIAQTEWETYKLLGISFLIGIPITVALYYSAYLIWIKPLITGRQ